MIGAEIVRHHRVIGRWLAGTAAREEFARFAGAHGPGFSMVTPDGRTLGREQALAGVRAAYGSVPGLVIEIRHVRVAAASGPLVVAAYEEWHGEHGRTATAVLRMDGTAPTWLHLHETWLP